MKTNAAGRALIRKYEGYSLAAYPDPESPLAVELRKPPAERRTHWSCLPGDPWTIGIGATGHGIGPGVVWTDEEVLARFEDDLARAERDVCELVESCLNENQFSALVSFVFNVGAEKCRTCGPGQGPITLLRKLNDGDYLGAAEEFIRWDHSRGVEVDGLRARRLDEQALFLTKVS